MSGQGWNNGVYPYFNVQQSLQQNFQYGQPQLQQQRQSLQQQQPIIGQYSMMNHPQTQDLTGLSTIATTNDMHMDDYGVFDDMAHGGYWSMPATDASCPSGLDGAGDMVAASHYDIAPAPKHSAGIPKPPGLTGSVRKDSAADTSESEAFQALPSKERKQSLAVPQGLGPSLLPRPSVAPMKRRRSSRESSDEVVEEVSLTQNLGPASSAHTIPARPKPGRKPAQDKPMEKRKAQNRAAQRAFRIRKSEINDELLADVQKLKVKNEELTGEMERAWAENERLKRQHARDSKERDEGQRTMAELRQQLADQAELIRAHQTTWQGNTDGYEMMNALMQSTEHALASATRADLQQHMELNSSHGGQAVQTSTGGTTPADMTPEEFEAHFRPFGSAFS